MRDISEYAINFLPLPFHSLSISSSKSDLHEPLFELIKQVKMYSRPWSEKKFAILELEQDFHR